MKLRHRSVSGILVNQKGISVKAVIQRVCSARVEVAGNIVGQIEKGLLVLLGVAKSDEEQDLIWLAEKIAGLRIFEDAEGKMNLSVQNVQGAILLVSQFTLLGDCRKGKRPSFIEAAAPEQAKLWYEKIILELKGYDIPVQTGIFQAEMQVHLVNDGPVTLVVDSRKKSS